jgi:hypothetical protein
MFKVSKPEMVNKIYLYDDKMTVLYNTQDSHSDVTIDDLSSSRVVLVEMGGVEPPSESALTGTSPGAAGFAGRCASPFPSGQANRQACPSGSFMMHGTRKA